MFLNIEQFYASVFDCERAATATLNHDDQKFWSNLAQRYLWIALDLNGIELDRQRRPDLS